MKFIVSFKAKKNLLLLLHIFFLSAINVTTIHKELSGTYIYRFLNNLYFKRTNKQHSHLVASESKKKEFLYFFPARSIRKCRKKIKMEMKS